MTSAIAARSIRHRNWRILAWISVGVFAAYRLPELTRYALWYDEIFSITLVQMGWLEMLGAAIRDRTNPPLFYILLKLWRGLGAESDSVAWMRLLPCLLGIGAAPLIVALARRTEKLSVGIVATAVGAASPLLVFLSNELRGYSLLLFLSALTMICFARVVETIGWEETIIAEGDSPNGLADVAPERKRRIVLFALCSLALVYTHYFGWLLLASLVAACWTWHRPQLTSVLLALGAVVFMFLPWVVSVSIASQGVAAPLANVDWITAPTAWDIPRFYDALVARVLSPEIAWVGLLALGGVAAGMVAVYRRREHLDAPRAAALILLALLPVAIAYAAGLSTGRSVFVPRYLVIAAPAWWLLIGMGTSAHAALAAMFSIFTLAAGALREVRGGDKIPWDRLVSAVARDAGGAPGTIYTFEGFTALPSLWYARSEATGLTVRPVGDLKAMSSPAWLVVRRVPGDTGHVLGGGLTPAGLEFTKVFEAAIPSHSVAAFRVLLR